MWFGRLSMQDSFPKQLALAPWMSIMPPNPFYFLFSFLSFLAFLPPFLFLLFFSSLSVLRAEPRAPQGRQAVYPWATRQTPVSSSLVLFPSILLTFGFTIDIFQQTDRNRHMTPGVQYRRKWLPILRPPQNTNPATWTLGHPWPRRSMTNPPGSDIFLGARSSCLIF